MSLELTLNLLVIEESRSDADALANILRNAGYKYRLTHVENKSDMDSALENQMPDLILCAMGLDLSLQDVITSVQTHEHDIPVIAVGETCDEQTSIQVMQTGACDLCSYDLPDHLQLVVKREIGQLMLRRENLRFQQQYLESEKRAHQLMESSRDAIAYIHEGMHIFANHSYLDMFCFDNMEAIEGTPILDIVTPDKQDEFKDFLRDYDKNEEQDHELKTIGVLPNGKHFDAAMEFTPASIENEPCTQIIIRNQSSDSEELELKLKHLSKQDMVTGLYNRQYFIEELELATTEVVSGADSGAIIYLLIDNFKDIKDSVGISIADRIICDVADIIREQSVDTDISARFGDHSFSILRHNCSDEDVQVLGEKLRKEVEDHIADIEDQSVTTTCSIGMSMITEHTPNAQEVLSRADLACEVARSSGGNKTHMHNPVVDEQLGKERNQQVNVLIQEALDNGLFQLMFQPIVSLQGDNRENYEVLLRMIGNDDELILPAQFLTVAEETGQINDIDRWVIKKAVAMLAERRRQDFDSRFFIKLSISTICDTELPAYVMNCLQEAKVPGDAIVFEIPEQGACHHLKQAKFFVKTVQEAQCGTLLDHFGKSPNSFQILKHLPVDILKIDGSFIHNLATNSDNQAVVKSILETARSMNKMCIAEFVQDAHSLAVLWQSGINYIQGNFLQEPSTTLDYDFTSEVA